MRFQFAGASDRAIIEMRNSNFLAESQNRIQVGVQNGFGGIPAQLAIYFCAYLLLYRYSNIFHTTDLRSTPWNPETGIAVVVGALYGWIAVPVIIVANFLGNILWGSTFPVGWSFASAVAQSLIFTGSAAFVKNRLVNASNPNVGLVVSFLVFATFVTLASVIARLMISSYAFRIAPSYLYSYTLAVSVGNLVGILTTTPLFYAFGSVKEFTSYLRRWRVFQYGALAAIAAVSLIVFGIKSTNEFKVFYLIFLPVIAFAIQDGLVGASFAVLLSDLAMIAILSWRQFEPSTALELQLLMTALSATGLILGASISERQRVSAELEQSHLKLRESQTALMQASRISLASEMAAALAHELNQPLSSVRNFVRSVRRRLDAGRLNKKALKIDIDEAVDQIDKAAELIKSTRRFLARGEVNFKSLDTVALISGCCEMVQSEMQKNKIALIIEIPPKLPKIIGNESQLQQVLLNLLKNAKEAISESRSIVRKIKIQVSNQSRPGYLEISVTDSGPGISADLKDSLFAPLKSSKSDGLGLGLSLCNTIVKSHGGDIWLDQANQSGARFIVTMPTSRAGK
ncbi:MAG: ATP-binding protein [Aestuariivirga sp.]